MSTVVEVVAVVAALAVGVVLGTALAARSGARRRPAPEAAPAPKAADPVDALPRALWNLPLGIVVAGPDGTVVYRNAAAQGLASGRHAGALVESAVADVLAEAPRSGRIERTVDLYGPPRRHVVVKATPMADGDRASGSLVTIEDVTDQHRVDAVRRDFVANVSHELKTPVGAVGVLAEALRGEDDPEVVDRLAGRLLDEAIRLGHLVDHLLALSRIESGELFEAIELDLADVASAAVEHHRNAADLRGVALIARPPADPVVVLGDERQLVSAVGNLVENAVKYSDPGAEVAVTVGRADDGRAAIDVVDRGVGIPQADLQRIFERFYRVDPARSRVTGGTGLGLSIVRHVALNHGGEVLVRSAEGEGSTFSLRLPVLAPHPGAERGGGVAPASATTGSGA